MQGKYPNDIGDWEVALSTVKVVDTALVSVQPQVTDKMEKRKSKQFSIASKNERGNKFVIQFAKRNTLILYSYLNRTFYFLITSNNECDQLTINQLSKV